MPALYRLAKAGADASNPQPIYPTRRPPGNVPYLVDNLWEWRRPLSMPNRRHAVYASPTAELARAAGGAAHGEVFVVQMGQGTSAVCQIPQADARDHPDVKALPKLLVRALGVQWMDLPVQHKLGIAALWAPCLARDETEALFQTDTLAPHRQAVWDAISLWDEARRVEPAQELPYERGEIFFEAAQYHLVRMAAG